MEFIELIKSDIKWYGQLLQEFDYEKNDIKTLIDFVLEIETDLFRARIKLERSINQ